jgi:hypothetical protein
MANLQANLRSQYALALEDIPRLLRSVNRLFYKNTETNHYATTFFAVYDDEARRLRYVNCGHNPPILVRANGDVERLNAAATVLGLFEDWDCESVNQWMAGARSGRDGPYDGTGQEQRSLQLGVHRGAQSRESIGAVFHIWAAALRAGK